MTGGWSDAQICMNFGQLLATFWTEDFGQLATFWKSKEWRFWSIGSALKKAGQEGTSLKFSTSGKLKKFIWGKWEIRFSSIAVNFHKVGQSQIKWQLEGNRFRPSLVQTTACVCQDWFSASILRNVDRDQPICWNKNVCWDQQDYNDNPPLPFSPRLIEGFAVNAVGLNAPICVLRF